MLPSPVRALRLLALVALGLCLVYLSFVILEEDRARLVARLTLEQQQKGRRSSGIGDEAGGPIPRSVIDDAPIMQLLKATAPDPKLEAEWLSGRRRASADDGSTSQLGNWLLSPEDSPPPTRANNRSGPYVILVWRHGPFLERRHLRRFSPDKKYSPWEDCSVNNCRLTYDSNDLHTADAVIFHMHQTRGRASLPERKNWARQRWIFLSDESPANTFLQPGQRIADYDGVFNWSMTYRTGSDVPVPYGRTVPRTRDPGPEDGPLLEALSRKLGEGKLAAVLGSNCSGENDRWKYIVELRRFLGDKLQILGRCLNGNRTVCPGHFDADCPILNDFKFYLSFENSNCREYLSEKVFWHGYHKHAVPVIMGAPRTDCQRLLPPRSYLHVDDFANPSSLADYLLYLDRVDADYLKLHSWRRRYRVINEHGYFGSASKHYCRVCEALNYNSPGRKVYRDLESFWSRTRDCRLPERS